MSEFTPAPERLPSFEQHEPLTLPTAEQAEPLRAGEQDPLQTQAEHVEVARESVEQTASTDNPLERFQAAEAASAPTETPPPNKTDIKHNFTQQLKSIQRKQSAPARTLSRIVHQPVVRVTSEVAGKTISRPSGLLGGGILAFVGSSAYLYLAKHIGFQYNGSVFLLFLAAGFVLGLALELVLRLVLPKKTA